MVAGTAAAADGSDASLQFSSEAEFVAKFGEQGQKTGKGQYVLQRGTTSYRVNFGAAALRATLAKVEERRAQLPNGADDSAKAASSDSAQLEQRRDELWQRLSVTGAKASSPRCSSCEISAEAAEGSAIGGRSQRSEGRRKMQARGADVQTITRSGSV